MRHVFVSIPIIFIVTISLSDRNQMLLAQGLVFDTPGPHTVSSLRFDTVGFANNQAGLLSRVDAEVTVSTNAEISVRKVGIGNLIGIHAADSSHVTVQASTNSRQISLNELSSGNATGLLATEDGTIEYAGSLNLTSKTNGDAFFASAGNTAQLTVSGQGEVYQFGNGSAFGTSANGFAEVILGGQITITDNGNGNAVLATANEHSSIAIIGSGII